MASSSSSSNSAPAEASSTRSWKYDVFFSFRGEDTRKTFVDHLYSALVDRLIRVYKDDEALPRGDSIGPSLLKSIEESQIAVIVFSKNYADSSWCLDELAYIMKCRDERGLIVMPIFYDVDPSEVRNQKRKFGEAFAKQEEKNATKAKSWKKALVDASNIAGWEPKHIASGHEAKAIKEIVNKVHDRLFPLNLDVNEDLVGMMPRLQVLKSLLAIGSGGVRMVGIWGVGGGGKTTLATSLCMEVSHHFDGHYIVDNIREEFSRYGLKKLQENILSSVLGTKVKVQSVAEGKRKIESILYHSNVLILLDDVDDLGQLEAFAGSHNWFGTGRRIIITTRDEHLLRTHRVDKVSPVNLLSFDEAILLFNQHAYNEKEPARDYKKLSLRVISYANGLPLALQVLGSFLYDKDEKEWISTLDRLKDIPQTEIVEHLKISYDGLQNVEKELFLDIACFFRGKWINEVMEILDACGFHSVIGIKVLRQKALITTTFGRLGMHDLIQEMGHYIVRGKHPNNPEKHSRVWKEADIDKICLGDARKENQNIEAIQYSYSKRQMICDSRHDYLSRFNKIISNMKKLRSLSVINEQFDKDDDGYAEGPYFLTEELRYFYCNCSPVSPFPDNFQAMNLVFLKLENGLQKELWKGYKCLPHLKVLELCNMKNLLSTPDFDGLPCLQKVKLSECAELEEIHSSLGNHRSLVYVSVSSCYMLRMFPTIVQMEKLNTLEIEYCGNILKLLEIQANMESLEKLSLCRNWIKVYLSLVGQRYTLVKTVFHKLTCILQKNLQELELNGNSFSRFDFSLSQLTRLKFISLSGCKRLVELPELPSSVAILKADYCNSLRTVGNRHTNYKWLHNVSLLNGGIVIDGSGLLQSMLQGRGSENHSMVLQLEGLEIPKKFLPCLVRGNTCTLQLPENWGNDFCGFLMCAVYTSYLIPWLNMITMKKVMSGEMGMDSR